MIALSDLPATSRVSNTDLEAGASTEIHEADSMTGKNLLCRARRDGNIAWDIISISSILHQNDSFCTANGVWTMNCRDCGLLLCMLAPLFL